MIICRITLSCSRPPARVRDLWCSSFGGSLREDVVVGEIVIEDFFATEEIEGSQEEGGGRK